MQIIMKWVTDNWETWKRICRINNYEFDEIELMHMLSELTQLSSRNVYFNIILIVFLTEYQKELPFLEEGF